METENQQTPTSTMQSTSRFHNLSDHNNPYRLDNSDTSVLSLLKSIWDELALHCPMPECSCGQMKVLTDRYQQDCVIQFLMGLNETYSNIRDQIMLMDPIPQVSKVFSLVQQQEKQHQMLLNTSTSESMALLSRNMPTNYKSSNRPYCHHCKIQGHTLEDCFKAGNAKPPICSHCNQNGHLAEKCYKLVGYPPGHKLYNRVKRPNVYTRQTNMVAVEDLSKNHTEKMDLISTQYQKILQLLHDKHNSADTHFSMGSNPTSSMVNSNNLPSMSGITTCLSTYAQKPFDISNVPWIIDTGATDHMICSTDLTSWTTIGLGEMKNGLYQFQHIQVPPNALMCKLSKYLDMHHLHSACVANTGLIPNLWHYRLGHISNSRLKLIKDSIVIKDTYPTVNQIPCSICPMARQHKLSFDQSLHKSSHNFELIHCDLWGPCSVTAYDGSKYFLTIVDDMSRSTWVYLLKNKSDTQRTIEAFYNLVCTQFETRIKYLRSDNGTEFRMADFYHSNGIIHQKTCVETPQQNGIVERKHQHILNVARALRFQAKLPLEFWNDCVLTAAYIINRIPTPLLRNKTPYEAIFKLRPTYDHFKVFGCLCFASTLSQGRRKFDPRARKCVFLGYPFGVKGYKLLDLESKETFLSRNVIFHEHHFPFSTPAEISLDAISPMVPQLQSLHTLNPLTTDHTSFDSIDVSPTTASSPATCPPVDSPSILPLSDHSNSSIPSPSTSTSPHHIPIRKSDRMKQAPKYLQDFHCQMAFFNPASPIQATMHEEGLTAEEIDTLPKYKFCRLEHFEQVDGEIQEICGGMMTDCGRSPESGPEGATREEIDRLLRSKLHSKGDDEKVNGEIQESFEG
ncbi:hypothetical protein SADUNF_Sadunf14G0053300 [Salix dunnii]|uniref:Integrase catalytic domain-containing protein n=1 Tax=Salix dunnii TaxID=1413687 RepID=A0A835MJK5_9ROSI|nr:hypothetical protein SADUNF_Sadunf14G0053300 [Salix dunnii]